MQRLNSTGKKKPHLNGWQAVRFGNNWSKY